MANTATLQDVLRFINSPECDDYAREAIRHAFNLKHKAKVRDAVRKFRVGDRVEFSNRWGRLITGKVTKINRKNIKVLADDGVPWNVTATLLRPRV